jgi:hypothetical protein
MNNRYAFNELKRKYRAEYKLFHSLKTFSNVYFEFGLPAEQIASVVQSKVNKYIQEHLCPELKGMLDE